jgi:N-acetylneuraminic acid mutarotase
MENLHSTKMKNSGKMPKNRMQCTLAYYNESLYYFGSSSDGEAYDNNLYRYDLNSEEWEVVETIGEKPPPISLHSVFVYNGDMFILFGAIIETQSASNKVNKFNFERKKWSLVSLSAELIRVLSASVLIGSKGYYLYGRDEKGIFNSVYTLDFSQDPIKVQELSKNFLTPTERFSHCAHVINTFMYVFGGTSGYLHDTENIYSDMWRFDLIHKTWEFVTPLGEVPTKRKHFASTKIGGNRFVVFGGENEGGLLNDLYFFHEPYLKWYKISPSGTLIQGRNSACLVSLNNWLFIIGGKSYDKGFNDIWVYNFEDNELKILEVKLTKNNFNSVKCWAQEIEENVAEIIFTGGMDFVSTPSNYTITIRFFNESLSYNATIREVKNTACIIKAKSSSWKQGNKILSFGGHIYNSNMLKPFTLFNLEDNNCDFLEGPSDLNIYDHSIAHFNKSLYIFGGGGKIEHYKTLKIVSNNLFKVEVTDVPNFSLDYSDGFDSTGKLCGKGTYSDKKNCVNCPKGSFSKTLGSSNIDQCIPCPYGTFSSVEGAFNCLDCPNGFKCPIGSIFPHRDIILDYNKSVQPDEYSSDKETILKVNKALWLCFSALLTLLACSLFFYRVVWNYLSCIDVFSKEHNKCLGIPIIYNKTPIGGIFSVIFLLVALVLVISALIGFRMDNLQEYRALIPVVTLKEEIVSDSLSLNISFYIYGGECVKNDSCHPDIHYQDVGLDYLKYQMTCKVTTETCSILVVYEKMKIVSEKAEIFVNSKEYRSYSSSITINITADSSIPNQISSQMMTFTTSSPDTVFRGYDPSIVSYRFTPSVSLIQVFRSESSKWKEKITGFHISSYEEPKIGSLANYER